MNKMVKMEFVDGRPVFPTVKVEVVAVDGATTPAYATSGASGFDLAAIENVMIEAGTWKVVRTGLKVAIPYGFEIQIRPRSGLAAKNGLQVLNTPGTIDADYRGEIGVILMNHGKKHFLVEKGMRIAQGVLTPVYHARFVQVDSLDDTARGEGKFGSTGV